MSEKNEKSYELEEIIIKCPTGYNFSIEGIEAKIKEARTKSGSTYSKVILMSNGKKIAESKLHGNLVFTEEYRDLIKELDHNNLIDLDKQTFYLDKEKVESQFELQQEREAEKNAKIENEKAEARKKKDEKQKYINKNEKQQLESELGDNWEIVSEITDYDTIQAFRGSKTFIGNSYIAINKKTNEIRIAGRNQGGELEFSDLQVSKPTTSTVTKINNDGKEVEERQVEGLIYSDSSHNDALKIEIESGKVSVSRAKDFQTNNNFIEVDTKQTEPTTEEVNEMANNVEKMEEVTKKLDEMEKDELITHDEREELLEKISSGGKPLEEDLEDLEQLEKDRRDAKEIEERLVPSRGFHGVNED